MIIDGNAIFHIRLGDQIVRPALQRDDLPKDAVALIDIVDSLKDLGLCDGEALDNIMQSASTELPA